MVGSVHVFVHLSDIWLIVGESMQKKGWQPNVCPERSWERGFFISSQGSVSTTRFWRHVYKDDDCDATLRKNANDDTVFQTLLLHVVPSTLKKKPSV